MLEQSSETPMKSKAISSKHFTLPSHEYWFQAGIYKGCSRYPVTSGP
jgi:hypothetical protein